MSNIPFSLPVIDGDVISEVNDALANTGWLTTGPKARELEQEIARITGQDGVVGVNSWTSGASIVLKWFGVGPGDEVIVPAYTYCATAFAALNIGATPVMVDIDQDFHVSAEEIAKAITPRTKAIVPVDIGGWPCDYEQIMLMLNSDEVSKQFKSANERQEKLGRPLVLADAAHSIGARLNGNPVGGLTDFTVFSFHSVKNITTGEGGAIAHALPSTFDWDDTEKEVRLLTLNGQTKSAFQKSSVGGWRYDIVDHGLKANLPDICAAIGLAQIRKYEKELLPDRIELFEGFNRQLSEHNWAVCPRSRDDKKTVSSCHLYQLRVTGADEQCRNDIIKEAASMGVAFNVHYVPMPMLTHFKRLGYRIEDFPQSFRKYENEISLPVYNGLTSDQRVRVAETAIQAVNAAGISSGSTSV